MCCRWSKLTKVDGDLSYSSVLAVAVGVGGFLPLLFPTCRMDESYFLYKSYTSFDTFDSSWDEPVRMVDGKYDAILPAAL